METTRATSYSPFFQRTGNLHNSYNYYHPGASFMKISIPAHCMPLTNTPGKLLLTKVLNPVSNPYHQSPKLETAAITMIIMKASLISVVIMVVGVTRVVATITAKTYWMCTLHVPFTTVSDLLIFSQSLHIPGIFICGHSISQIWKHKLSYPRLHS